MPRRGSASAVFLVCFFGLTLADVATWWTYHHGYAQSYEYWLEGTAGAIAWGIVGWFVTTRVPTNRLGPLMLGVFAVATVQAVAGNLAVIAYHESWQSLVQATSGGVFKASQTAVVGLGILVLLLAPDGRPLNAFYRGLALTLACAMSIGCLIDLLRGSTTEALRGGNPHASLVAVTDVPWVNATYSLAMAVGAVSSLAAIVGLGLRWRRSAGDERRQVTWVVLGGIAGPLLIWVMAGPVDASPPIVGSLVWAVASLMLPLGIAVAVLRHGLYELDSIVSRTVSYAIVTGAVLVVYAVVVAAVSELAPGSDRAAVTVATLAAAATARPVLRRVRIRIDRQFNRTRFDHDQALAGFGAQVQSTVDTDHVRSQLSDLLHETLEPRQLHVWLKPRTRAVP